MYWLSANTQSGKDEWLVTQNSKQAKANAAKEIWMNKAAN